MRRPEFDGVDMLKIVPIEVTPLGQNARILFSSETHKARVVDPGGDVALILNHLDTLHARCEEIWLTHSHFDHCGGVALLKEATGAVLKAHRIENVMRSHVEQIVELYGLPKDGMRNCPEPDEYIDEGDVLSLDGYTFQVLHTPGHSPGHLCFYQKREGILIAGDTLFNLSIGRTDLPGGDHETLFRSLEEKILVLPDATQVLPGHGPDTTIGFEKKNNPFLLQRAGSQGNR